MNRISRPVGLALALIGFGSLTVLADTLVLRNGRTYSGDLISVQNGQVEFQTGRFRVEKFRLDDVEHIEFSRRDDNDRDRPGSNNSGDRDRDRPGGRPSGLRERETEVRGAEGWTRTGIELQDGQQLWFDARGEVRWGPGRKDGPGGESGSPRNPARPIPNRAGASLIGRLGENGDPFFIGNESGPIRVRGKGTLYLGINDDYLLDNSGGFRVIVYY